MSQNIQCIYSLIPDTVVKSLMSNCHPDALLLRLLLSELPCKLWHINQKEYLGEWGSGSSVCRGLRSGGFHVQALMSTDNMEGVLVVGGGARAPSGPWIELVTYPGVGPPLPICSWDQPSPFPVIPEGIKWFS